MKEWHEKILIDLGLSTVFIGTSSALKEVLVVNGSVLKTTGTVVMIVSLVMGSLLGEWIDIEKWLEHFGTWLREKDREKNESLFV